VVLLNNRGKRESVRDTDKERERVEERGRERQRRKLTNWC